MYRMPFKTILVKKEVFLILYLLFFFVCCSQKNHVYFEFPDVFGSITETNQEVNCADLQVESENAIFNLVDQFVAEFKYDDNGVVRSIKISKKEFSDSGKSEKQFERNVEEETEILLDKLSEVVNIGALLCRDEILVVGNGKGWRKIVYEKAFVIQEQRVNIWKLNDDKLLSISIYFPIPVLTTVDAIVGKTTFPNNVTFTQVIKGDELYYVKGEIKDDCVKVKPRILFLAGPI